MLRLTLRLLLQERKQADNESFVGNDDGLSSVGERTFPPPQLAAGVVGERTCISRELEQAADMRSNGREDAAKLERRFLRRG